MLRWLWFVLQIWAAIALQFNAENVCSTCECKNGSVDCSNRSISVYPIFKNLTNVINLSFAHNFLVRVIQFQKIPVKRLSFAHNEIQSIDEAAFKNLVDLTSLDLSYNLLTSDTLLPNSLKGNYAADLYEPLRYLKELNLAHNQLHTLHPDIFEHTPNLQILKLNGNPLKIITQGTVIAISSIPNLKELDLSQTLLASLPENLLHTPKYLEVLNLANNLLTEAPKELENSHRLRWLSLNENPIKRIQTFSNLPFLKTLHLCKMPSLESIQGRSLSNLPKLEEFYCSDNRHLVKIEKTAFSAAHDTEEGETWPPLKVMILSNNSLSSIDRHLVGRWDEVQMLNLQNNPWMCDCENQWMVSVLAPMIEKTQPEMLTSFKCVKPPEMNNSLIIDLNHRNYHMRCLDMYNHTPEKDVKLLISICILAMISAPFLMAFALYYKRSQSRSGHQIFLRAQDYASYSQLKLFPLEK